MRRSTVLPLIQICQASVLATCFSLGVIDVCEIANALIDVRFVLGCRLVGNSPLPPQTKVYADLLSLSGIIRFWGLLRFLRILRSWHHPEEPGDRRESGYSFGECCCESSPVGLLGSRCEEIWECETPIGQIRKREDCGYRGAWSKFVRKAICRGVHYANLSTYRSVAQLTMAESSSTWAKALSLVTRVALAMIAWAAIIMSMFPRERPFFSSLALTLP